MRGNHLFQLGSYPIPNDPFEASIAPRMTGRIIGKNRTGSIISLDRVFTAMKENNVPTVANPKVASTTVIIKIHEKLFIFNIVANTGNKIASIAIINKKLTNTLLRNITSLLIGLSNKPSIPPCSCSRTKVLLMIRIPEKANETQIMPAAISDIC